MLKINKEINKSRVFFESSRDGERKWPIFFQVKNSHVFSRDQGCLYKMAACIRQLFESKAKQKRIGLFEKL